MTFEVRLRPEAEQDLSDAAVWHEEQLSRLGHHFLDEVLAVFASRAEAPLRYPIVYRNTRRALIRRFPFGVYYRVATNTIIVIAVMHASRDLGRWKSST